MGSQLLHLENSDSSGCTFSRLGCHLHAAGQIKEAVVSVRVAASGNTYLGDPANWRVSSAAYLLDKGDLSEAIERLRRPRKQWKTEDVHGKIGI